MADWKVGDTILVSSYNFYANLWGREMKFSIEDGIQPSEYSGSAYVAYTPQEWADRERRAQLVRAFRKEWGASSVPHWVSLDALADIVEIMRAEKAAHAKN